MIGEEYKLANAEGCKKEMKIYILHSLKQILIKLIQANNNINSATSHVIGILVMYVIIVYLRGNVNLLEPYHYLDF